MDDSSSAPVLFLSYISEALASSLVQAIVKASFTKTCRYVVDRYGVLHHGKYRSLTSRLVYNSLTRAQSYIGSAMTTIFVCDSNKDKYSQGICAKPHEQKRARCSLWFAYTVDVATDLSGTYASTFELR